MTYIERAYVCLQEEYRQLALVCGEDDKGLLSDYKDFDRMLKDSVFPMMLSEGGKETDKGILYKGFEYRVLDSIDDDYYCRAIEPSFRECVDASFDKRAPYRFSEIMDLFEDYSALGYLGAMTEKEAFDDFKEIAENYPVYLDNDMSVGMEEGMDEFLRDEIDLDALRDEINRHEFDEGFAMEELDFKDICIGNDFKDYVSYLSGYPQLYAVCEGERYYLPFLKGEDRLLSFDEISTELDSRFEAETEAVAYRENEGVNFHSDAWYEPDDYEEQTKIIDLKEYLYGLMDMLLMPDYGMFQTGNDVMYDAERGLDGELDSPVPKETLYELFDRPPEGLFLCEPEEIAEER
jgi:hypothetical protein